MMILAGIDGTGTSDSAAYQREFQISNVSRAIRAWTGGPVYYQRGPTNSGIQTKDLADKAANFVRHMHGIFARNGRLGIFLTGYSRGAAAAIDACRTLQGSGIIVDCLLLFDSVDRTGTVDRVDRIPPNVRVCYHAIRNPVSGSRVWMGNCGRQKSGNTAYNERSFVCTHGGVGGVPWNTAGSHGFIEEDLGFRHPIYEPSVIKTTITPLMDNMAATQVWRWAQEALRVETANCRSRLTGRVSDTWSLNRLPPARRVPRPPPAPMFIESDRI